MADVTITAVGLGETAITQFAKVAEAAAVGAVLFFDPAMAAWRNADANDTALTAGSDGVGVLINTVETSGQYGVIATGGLIYIDTGLTKGTTYIVSSTAGRMAPDSDSASGWYKTTLGVAGVEGSDFDELFLQPLASNQAIV